MTNTRILLAASALLQLACSDASNTTTPSEVTTASETQSFNPTDEASEQFVRTVLPAHAPRLRAAPPLTIYSQNTWSSTDSWSVFNNYGYRGSGLTISLVETAWVSEDHPELDVTRGNSPFDLSPGSPDHANRVAAIMAADGHVVPEAQGFLPDSEIIAYKATAGLTKKKVYYKFATWAAEAGAVIMNASSGVGFNCNKLGDYSTSSKWRDRAIHETGLLVVVAAGNTKDADGVVDPCLQIPFGNIKHDTAKNDLVVGNWDTTVEPATINAFSMVGPTADGRLKPDLVAPGEGTDTVLFDEETGQLEPSSMFGTSAAAPIVSGIAGWVFEAIGSNARAHTVKAILLHTAQDVGLPGPDFTHGYGVVQAAPAIRLAQSWSDYGWDGTVPLDGSTQVHTVEIPPNTLSYKVTLAWSDIEGAPSDPVALVNNLDLTVVTPDGSTTFYPWDLTDETVAAAPGTGSDQLNNVEQLVLQNADGSPLEAGSWTINVGSSAPLAEVQDFSVALTPPCPIQLTSDLTLSDDVECDGAGPGDAVIEIVADNVTLDCNQFAIRGGGTAVGVRIKADGVRVERCTILGVGVGVETTEESTDAELVGHSITAERTAVHLQGRDHQLYDSSLNAMNLDGTGVAVDGDRMIVGAWPARPNTFWTANASEGVAVDVLIGSQDTDVTHNNFSGSWQIGVRAAAEAAAETTVDVDDLKGSASQW